MAHRALQLVSRGLYPPVPVGEEIPETYMDSLGNEQPIDFERLVALGAAEKITGKPKRSKAEEPEAPEPEGESEPDPAPPEE